MTIPAEQETIPAFLNPAAGGAERMREAMSQAGLFEIQELGGRTSESAIGNAVRRGARRIVVAGGDGTIATAAAELAGTSTELAIIPAGTLNHFARDLGIPTDPAEAIDLAIRGEARPIDLGSVNGRFFLNTSSVGAYVVFVRTRERLERHLGYRPASFLAALRTLAHLRTFRVRLQVEGALRVYATPLVFVGVDERELRIPMLGGRIPEGRRGLHLLIPHAQTRLGLTILAFRSIVRGVRAAASTPELDSFVVADSRVELRRPYGKVALDGELVLMRAPLEYRLERDAVRVVAPPPRASDDAPRP